VKELELREPLLALLPGPSASANLGHSSQCSPVGTEASQAEIDSREQDEGPLRE